MLILFAVANGDEAGEQESFNWQVQLYGSNLSYSPVYFLWLNRDDPNGFTSHYFNITDRPSSSSSSSTSSSSTSISLTSSSLTSSVTSNSLTTTVTASPNTTTLTQKSSDTVSSTPFSGGSSGNSIKAGLGIGLGLGIPCVLIVGFWGGLRLLKQRQRPTNDINSSIPLSPFPDTKHFFDQQSLVKSVSLDTTQLHELPAKNPGPHEVPG